MTSDQIRESFLKYFESKSHLRVSSSSLIPVGDPTLLLTTAGMVQFKSYFTGQSEPPSKRLTSSQKSFRVVDIDEVGDDTHLTLFEMLGNFSIGDYFKKEAVIFALDFFISVLELPKDNFVATVHHDDNETANIWKDNGITTDKIFIFGDEDNWWGPAGLEGPCGPCSELHYDRGAEKGCGQQDCGPNCSYLQKGSDLLCDRYVELWNLVFMQFYHHIDGTRTTLPSPSVDTGLGLERLAAVMQDVKSVFDTDIFVPLLNTIVKITGLEYGIDSNSTYSMRVVAEHARSASFLLADGVVPGNEGRGYVLRRIIRRAIRHGLKLGLNKPFLGEIYRVVASQMGVAYPELRQHQDFILTALELEEQKFQHVFEKGHAILTDSIKRKTRLSGNTVFQLWDTYGFPVEITQEIVRESGMDIDIKGFEKEMTEQRNRARESSKFGGDQAKIRVYEELSIGNTQFVGYDQLTGSSIVLGLVSDGKSVDKATEGDVVEIALVDTPFYPEGGGQVGDAGEMVGSGCRLVISDTQTVMPGLIMHTGKVQQGTISLGQTIDTHVDPIRREDTARNHTATHLLHAGLRQILGAHVRQAGSLVAPDRLRFDFSHVGPISSKEIEQIELLVNEKIRQNSGVSHDEDAYESAVRRGALAFFGDKYEEKVRLIEIANGTTFSFEVCGGTHVNQTGELGALYILSESSIGSGMRRIEAVSGRGANKIVRERFESQNALASLLQTGTSQVGSKVQSLIDEVDELKHSNERLEHQVAAQTAEQLLDSAVEIQGIRVLAQRIDVSNNDSMRNIGDLIRDKIVQGVIVLGAIIGERPTLIAMVTPDLINRGLSAVTIVKEAAKTIQGGGGGRDEIAQAGGRRADKLNDALAKIPGLVSEIIHGP